MSSSCHCQVYMQLNVLEANDCKIASKSWQQFCQTFWGFTWVQVHSNSCCRCVACPARVSWDSFFSAFFCIMFSKCILPTFTFNLASCIAPVKLIEMAPTTRHNVVQQAMGSSQQANWAAGQLDSRATRQQRNMQQGMGARN